MRKFAITLFVSFITMATVAQKRQMRLAKEDLEKGNYKEAMDRIVNYENKEGVSAETHYLKYLFYKKTISSIKEIDSAFYYFNIAHGSIAAYQLKDKEEICKSWNFCENNKASDFEEMESIIFSGYSRDRKKEIVQLFITKYPTNAHYYESIALLDTLKFDEIKTTKNISTLQNFIETNPQSVFKSNAQDLIYILAFESVQKSSQIKAYEDFIKEYPQAPQTVDAYNYLTEANWKLIALSEDRNKYSKYLEEYPNSPHANEAQNKIEKLDWEKAKSENTELAYSNFINNYPQSSFIQIAQSKYESLRENIFPYLTKNMGYKLFNVDTRSFLYDEEFDFLQLVGDGLFIASRYNKYGVIDKLGRVIIPITYNCINVEGEFFKVTLSDNVSLFNKKGVRMTDFIYKTINFNKNFYSVSQVSTDSGGSASTYGLLDKQAKVIITCKYNQINPLTGNRFLVSQNGKYFILDETEIILTSKYNQIDVYYDSILAAKQNDKYGIIDLNGKINIPLNYESIAVYQQIKKTEKNSTEYFYIVRNKINQEALINQSGNVLIPFQKNAIGYLNEGIFSIEVVNANDPNDNKLKLFNANSASYIGKEALNWVTFFKDGIARAGKSGKSGFVDQEGKWVITPIYSDDLRFLGEPGEGDGYGGEEYYFEEEVSGNVNYCPTYSYENLESISYYEKIYEDINFSEGLAIVKVDESYGFVDMQGNVVIPIIYSSVNGFYKGITNVTIKKGENYTQQVIDKSGRVILSDASITLFYDKMRKALIQNKKEYFSLDLNDMKLTRMDLINDFEFIRSKGNYFISEYKGKELTIMPNSEVLAASNIDFSKYDLKKLLVSIGEKYMMGNYDDAINDYKTLSNDYQYNFTINYMLGKCYSSKKDDYNANYYFTKAINIRPTHKEVRTERMELNYSRKYWNDALEDINYLIKISSAFDAYLYFKRAWANQEKGNSDDAFNDYSTILNYDPKNASCYNNRGVIFMNRRDFQKALTDYSNAVVNTPSTDKESLGLYRSNKGNALFSLKRKTEACAEWKKAAALNNSSAINNLKQYCK